MRALTRSHYQVSDKMILEEETHEKFGYYPSDLKPHSGKKILVVCDECKKIRETSKYHYRALCRSCSQKGKGNNNWKDNKIKRICIECGKEFDIGRYDLKYGRGKYCSNKCKNKNKIGENGTNWKGGKVKRTCIGCDKEFNIYLSQTKYGWGKYCSRECQNKARSKLYKGANSPGWKGGQVKRICKICGKPFYVGRDIAQRGRGKYCSYKCMGIDKSKNNRGVNNPNWKNGASFEPYCHKFNNEFKEYIRNKFGRTCFLCGKTEEENGKRLSVHHVNYDKKCGCAETEEDKRKDNNTCQFVPLCCSCNSKVNKNRNKWESYFKNKLRNTLNGWYI